MSDSTTTSTLESFINYKNLDSNVYYKDLSIFEKSIDGKSVLLSYNILNDYRKEIFDFIIPITLTNEEFQKYQYQPKKLAYDLYGSTEYYYMILFINSMTNIKEFNRRRINLMRAKDMSNVLSAIYSSESEYIERTQQLITQIENEKEG